MECSPVAISLPPRRRSYTAVSVIVQTRNSGDTVLTIVYVANTPTKMYQTHEHQYNAPYGAQHPPPPGFYGPPPPYGSAPVTQQPPPGTTVYVVPAQQEPQSSGMSAGQALCCGCCVGYCLACGLPDICCFCC